MTKKNIPEKRRHPRMPVISNLIEPVNLFIKPKTVKKPAW